MTKRWAVRASVLGALVVSAAGCPTPAPRPGLESGPATTGEGGIRVTMNPPPEQTIDLPGFEFDWDDLDRDDRGRPEAYQVARWVTERHAAAQRCMEAKPPATSQAIALLREIVDKVSDNSKARQFLAQIQYDLAAYWYRAADAIEYEMAWVDYKHETAPPDGNSNLPGEPLTDAEVTEFLKAAGPQLEACQARVVAHGRLALQHLLEYRAARPDDQAVPDKLWRLYLYVQNVPKALEWLDYVLAQMDQAGVLEQNPVRKSYLEIRKALANYVAQRRLSGEPLDGRGVFPWSQDPKAAQDRRARVGGAR